MNSFIFIAINGLSGKHLLLDRVGLFCAEYLPFAMLATALTFGVRGIAEESSASYWITIAASTILSRIVFTEGIRWLVPVVRPPHERRMPQYLTTLSGAGFPSAHAAFYFALAFSVFLFNREIGLLLIVGSVIMGVARVYAGIHWPADIIAGALVALASVAIVGFFHPTSVLSVFL